MTKKLKLKILLAILTTCSVLFVKPQSSLAQVNMSLLTEVAKSCQTDVLSPEYYRRMGIDISKQPFGDHLNDCISARYFYSLVLSKLPWLASTNEMLPKYPSSAAVSLIALLSGGSNLQVLDCVASQNASSPECAFSSPNGIGALYLSPEGSRFRTSVLVPQVINTIFICPSCVVIHDNLSSSEKIVDAFIKWFLTLDKLHRKEVISILGNEKAFSMKTEAQNAIREYEEISRRVKQQDREQRRREILGN